jgi:hypothetical protein
MLPVVLLTFKLKLLSENYIRPQLYNKNIRMHAGYFRYTQTEQKCRPTILSFGHARLVLVLVLILVPEGQS